MSYDSTLLPTHITCPACDGRGGRYAYDGRGGGWGDGEHQPCNVCGDAKQIPLDREAIRILVEISGSRVDRLERELEQARRAHEKDMARALRFLQNDPLPYADAGFISPDLNTDFRAARKQRLETNCETDADRAWKDKEQGR